MALAARCPACTTVFRVVPDQLKVAGGWVRCGRCGEVFHGQDEGVAPGPGEVADESPGLMVAQAPAPCPAAEPSVASPIDGPVAALPALAELEVPAPVTGPLPQPASLPELDLRADSAEAPVPIEIPAFVGPAGRASPWQQPHMRATLLLLALVAAALLVLQVTGHYRERWIANWPELRGWLAPGCAHGDCSLSPPRRIDALVVESSSLTEADSPGVYRLSVSVRNRSDLNLAMPALDLALTDVQGQTIARRVLMAAELGASQASLAARAEMPLQALLGTGEYRVAGYSIELFYP
jgi:predicted Zn finger-like uncharacterized protein